MSLGFVHACEQNHLNLSVIGGGGVVQLAAGKVVTCPLDPLFIYNFAFGVRLAYDAAGAEAAFKAAGRDYVHVLASPSSRPGLGDDLAGLGYRQLETQAYRRTSGTGSGAPGLLALGDFDAFLEVWRDSWGADDKTAGREEAYRRRFRDPRSRPFRTADGGGVLLLFDSGTTTQLCHFAVGRSAQGRGVGRRVLELARGLVPAGRPLWLFTAAGGAADRAAAAAGWDLDHTATDWMLELDSPGGHQAPPGPPRTEPLRTERTPVQLGRLDHVGIAVSDLAAARALYERVLGLEVTHEEVITDQGVHELLLRAGEAYVQLVAPLSADSPVGRFLARRGEGVHHVGYAVPDVAAAVADLRAQGFEVIDPAPRIGSGGTTIAFVHPKSMQGVLVELVEEGTGDRG